MTLPEWLDILHLEDRRLDQKRCQLTEIIRTTTLTAKGRQILWSRGPILPENIHHLLVLRTSDSGEVPREPYRCFFGPSLESDTSIANHIHINKEQPFAVLQYYTRSHPIFLWEARGPPPRYVWIWTSPQQNPFSTSPMRSRGALYLVVVL
jgi:hypothetical protein